MAQELLGLTRQRTGKARFSDLAGAVRAPIDSLAREFHRRRITVVSTPEPIALSGVDLEVIFQICLNLYLNARDAMASKGGGTLEVTLRRCDCFAENRRAGQRDRSPGGLPATYVPAIADDQR